jgi:hypothetical protein
MGDKTTEKVKKAAKRFKKMELHRFADRNLRTNLVRRAAVAIDALKISNNALAGDHAIETAFESFGLDPVDPRHWKLLLSILADAHFGAKQGRPKTWTPARRQQLANHIGEALRIAWSTGGTPPQRELAKIIKKTFAAQYRDTTEEQLYRQILG